MKVSILIRALNEAENIGRTLELIGMQDFRGRIEVIVLDTGSTDDTAKIAERMGAKVFSYDKPFSYGGTINEGARLASGDILVVLAAHAFPYDRAWLSELVGPFEDSGVAATTSRHVASRDDDPFIRRGIRRRFPVRVVYSYVGCPISVSNVSAAYRRELVLKYPFDETAKFSEDYIWASEIMRKGYRVVYVPTSVVVHADSDIRNLRRQAAQTVAVMSRGRKLRWGLLAFFARFVAMLIYDAPVVLRGRNRRELLMMSLRRRWNIALAWWAARVGADEQRARFSWVLLWPLMKASKLRESFGSGVRS